MLQRTVRASALTALLLAGTQVGCSDDAAETATAGVTAASGVGGSGAGGSGGGGGAGGDDGCPPGTHPAGDGCDAELAEWTDGPPLAQARDHHMTFVVTTAGGAFLYAAGGVVDNAETLASVEIAPILGGGAVGAWGETTPLLDEVAGAGVAVVGTTVVIAGGHTGATLTTECMATSAGGDGTLAPWAPCPDLNEKRFHLAMVSDGPHVFAIGGLTGLNLDNTPTVERASIDADGVVGEWEQVAPLPGKRSHHSAVVHDGAIYVLGGLEGNPAGEHTTLSDILRAPILEGGGLGEWTTIGDLDTTLTTHASFVHAGRLYVVGGIAGNANTDAVRRAAFQADGSLGAWEDVTPLPKARAHAHQAPLHDGFVYAVACAYNHDSIADVFVGRFE